MKYIGKIAIDKLTNRMFKLKQSQDTYAFSFNKAFSKYPFLFSKSLKQYILNC